MRPLSQLSERHRGAFRELTQRMELRAVDSYSLFCFAGRESKFADDRS
jgi:hypothetical protein